MPKKPNAADITKGLAALGGGSKKDGGGGMISGIANIYEAGKNNSIEKNLLTSNPEPKKITTKKK